MPASDRRCNPRLSLTIPVRFQDGSGAEVQAHATNISRAGLFLTSPRKLPVGTSLHMSMRVPTEISGSVFSELHCQGRVVHERESPEGVGYGVEIQKMATALR
jgi:PilZ domain